MILSHSRRFVFIHVHKTGGTSLDFALARRMQQGDVRFGPFDLSPEEPRRFALEVRNTLMTPLQWDQYFKFAFVRNPWDWLVSMYHNLVQAEWSSNVERAGYARNKRRLLRKILDTLDVPYGDFTFPVFLHECVLAGNVQDPWDFHWKGQGVHLFDDDGRQLVDCIGRFEHLCSNLARIAERIGLDTPIPRLNRTRHAHYSQYYKRGDREAVARHFQDDIARFGYSFDDGVRE